MSYGGSLRAAVFGANDGLLSNFSLLMGIAGAHFEPRFMWLTGVAGLLAGSFSMGAGEYVSMRSQRELYEQQIELEKQELEMSPDEEKEELSLIYQAKGIPGTQAEELAERILSNPETAIETLAREELGLILDFCLALRGSQLSVHRFHLPPEQRSRLFLTSCSLETMHSSSVLWLAVSACSRSALSYPYLPAGILYSAEVDCWVSEH